jgi:hypothetical protein
VTSREGYAYPLGSPDVRDARQNVVGYQTTALEGRFGLWRTALEPYYQFRDSTRRVTTRLLMPIAEFARLKLDEPVRIALDDEARVRLLPEKVQAEAPGPSGLVAVRLTALTLPHSISSGTYDDPVVVWVELIVTPGPEQTVGREETVDGYTATFVEISTKAELRVRVWADENRTRPGQVMQPGKGPFAGLTVNVRRTLKTRRRHTQPTIVDTDGVQQWMIFTPDYLFAPGEVVSWYRWDASLQLPQEDYEVSYSLELGDGYNLL